MNFAYVLRKFPKKPLFIPTCFERPIKRALPQIQGEEEQQQYVFFAAQMRQCHKSQLEKKKKNNNTKCRGEEWGRGKCITTRAQIVVYI